MAYATGRTFFDADSHIMELPDFLQAFADPDMRDRIPTVSLSSGGRLSRGFEELARTKAQPPAHVQELLALGDGLIAGPKGYQALGAFNGQERTQALDMLGFHQQLVFSTFSASIAFRVNEPVAVRYATARAHNRAIAAFCADDARLLGVAALPLDDTQLALEEVAHLVKLGLRAAWVPHRACGGRSPGHDDLDPVWAALADAGVPFVLHVGGHPLQVHRDWMNTGRAVPNDWLGGGENVRGKDMTSLHHNAETFLGTLVLDGVLERHPRLRGGAIELGAGWVPSLIKRLDWVAQIWKKSEPDLAALKRPPSQQIIEQLAFTPYPYEDVGDLIRSSDDRLYLFSSDYPHIEGGKNPLGRFEASLVAASSVAKDRFYSENFTKLFASA
jgi:uncharacterized protein